VEHVAPSPEALVRPWRTATVVASTIAAIELVLLVAGGVVLLGDRLSGHHTRKTTAAPAKARVTKAAKARPAAKLKRVHHAVAPAKPKLARAQMSVLVLNGNGRAGAAGMEANVVTARGYHVTNATNASRSDYPQSVVLYRPGFRPEATRLAHDVGIGVVAPLDGMRPSALGRAQVAIVVGER
jgi:hypothetical protein